jgi:hypothetical protein
MASLADAIINNGPVAAFSNEGGPRESRGRELTHLQADGPEQRGVDVDLSDLASQVPLGIVASGLKKESPQRRGGL